MKVITRIFVFLIAFLPTILTLFLLLEFFPHTGLGRIFSLPITITINCAIILAFINWRKKSGDFVYRINWGWMSILTIMVALILYPQDSGTHVIMKILKSLFGL
ncbi:hypothetical protein [Brevibacillus sp. SYSU BS000544]|uniref:hypothetical protein n=1 Tax=Brevibacillus sp. SYSU BS000544 TaxID=3416443 RepID=UPI003CE4E8D6